MPAPDSLAAWLSGRESDEVVELLTLRPDLAVPPPADSGVLATRAALRASVARTVDELDAFVVHVLTELVRAGAATAAVEVPGGTDTARALTELRARAVAWGPDDAVDGVRVVPSAAEVVRTAPPGRASPALDGVDVTARLGSLDAPARGLLDALAQGSPIGRTRDAAAGTPPDRPVPRLLAAGLLLKVDENTVELPAQVGAVLHATGADVAPVEPRPSRARRRAADVESSAAGEALELLRHAAALVAALGEHPAPVLRSGGLGVREGARLAKETSLDTARVALLAELLVGAGLVASDDAAEPAWTPTAAVDGWLDAEPAQRWAEVATAWLQLPRLPGMVGRRDERDKPLPALAEELRRPLAAQHRRRVLSVLGDLPSGAALDEPGVQEVLAWRHPRWSGRMRTDLVGWTLAEATALGVCARGVDGAHAMSRAGRALLTDPTTAAAALHRALPEPVDHVLVQADLTVVAPGPLQPDLEREIGLVADVESAGAATVYRVGPASVRRALDAGRTAAELHELFARRSRTPVPQALTYLVDDVARRHGRLRAGVARAFLRCDDEAVLAEVLAAPVAARLGLRRIAPTVTVSPAPLAELLAALREAGFAPAGEDAAGAVLDLAPAGARVALRRTGRAPPAPSAPSREQLAAVARAVRAGDSAARAVTAQRVVSDGTRAGGSATMSVLQQAASSRQTVWIGYVNAQGIAGQRMVDPVSVGGGVLEGWDPAAGEVRRYALHRITSVAVAQ